MNKIYVIIYFPRQRKAFCLDREYNFISDDITVWGKVRLGDIIEDSATFFGGQGIPQWAEDFEKREYRHIALWTNYYE